QGLAMQNAACARAQGSRRRPSPVIRAIGPTCNDDVMTVEGDWWKRDRDLKHQVESIRPRAAFVARGLEPSPLDSMLLTATLTDLRALWDEPHCIDLLMFSQRPDAMGLLGQQGEIRRAHAPAGLCPQLHTDRLAAHAIDQRLALGRREQPFR